MAGFIEGLTVRKYRKAFFSPEYVCVCVCVCVYICKEKGEEGGGSGGGAEAGEDVCCVYVCVKGEDNIEGTSAE